MHHRRRVGLALAGPAVVLLAAILFHAAWLTWLGSYLVVEQAPFPADAVVVLGGDLRGTRILKGAGLAWQGYAPVVLVSGSGDLYGYHESDLAVSWAVAHGFSPSLFVKLKTPVESTREEARAVIRKLRDLNARRFLLVTSTFHTRRAALIFRQEAPDLAFRVIASPDRYFTSGGWWKNREGRKIFVYEWTKTATNWLGI